MAENPKALQGAAVGTLQRVLAAFAAKRDDINDADLDDAQPVTLTVYLTMGDIRWARRFVRHEGGTPADFKIR